MDVSRIEVREVPGGWEASDGRRWPTCVEAERAIRAEASEGVLVVEWVPTTPVGRTVVNVVTQSGG